MTNVPLPNKSPKWYGWLPDHPDYRDQVYEVAHREIATLPPKISLRDKIPYVFNQEELGSCTGNSISLMYAFLRTMNGEDKNWEQYSRLFIYFQERKIEGTIDSDSGAMIRDGIQVVHKIGVPHERLDPYDIGAFKNPPSPEAMDDAAHHKIYSYMRVTNGWDFRHCLATGYPFVIGFTVYESFESDQTAKTGIVSMPGANEQILGGHAVCVIGYDTDFHNNPAFQKSGLDKTQVSGRMYEVQNSWGADWGDQGRFWMPMNFFENPNMADDSWTFRNK